MSSVIPEELSNSLANYQPTRRRKVNRANYQDRKEPDKDGTNFLECHDSEYWRERLNNCKAQLRQPLKEQSLADKVLPPVLCERITVAQPIYFNSLPTEIISEEEKKRRAEAIKKHSLGPSHATPPNKV